MDHEMDRDHNTITKVSVEVEHLPPLIPCFFVSPSIDVVLILFVFFSSAVYYPCKLFGTTQFFTNVFTLDFL